MKKKIKLLLALIRNSLFKKTDADFKLQIYVPKNASENFKTKLDEVLRRLAFFGLRDHVVYINHIGFKKRLDFSLLGFVDSKNMKLKTNEVFNFDFENYVIEGWEYHKLLSVIYHQDVAEGIKKGKATLQKLTTSLRNQYAKAYILGTGPSLEKANSIDWKDGIRIVSNTIVKDPELWDHINPHFIVAGDGIYHFGIGEFAKKFRKDLKICMARTDTYFVMPAQFYPFCLKVFPEFKDRLIPLPQGDSANFSLNLNVDYSLSKVGNVLPLLLLPLGCTMSDNVCLWGFDGRSPNDKLFWKNSSKHFYTDDVEELKMLHPGFFETLVPKHAPESYVKNVHGDSLDHAMSLAEQQGITFNMLHFSYTETLNKRYKESFS